MIVVNAEGENTIIISPGANGALAGDSITAEALRGAAVLCLCLEVPLPTVRAAARAGHDAGAQVLLNLSPYQEVPADLLALADVLLVNRAEAGLVLSAAGGQGLGPAADGRGWSEALERFQRLGLDRVIVTLGGDGSVVLDATPGAEQRVSVIEPVRVEVVDTTGCGDAFTGALASSLAAGASLVDGARFAGRASALAATAAGAQSSYASFAGLTPQFRHRQMPD
jgi:ribokinase